MFCSKCGIQIKANTKFCPNCGAEIDNSGSDTEKSTNSGTKKTYYVSSKNRTVALLLAIFGLFGFAGLQRFYVGKPLTGFLYFITFGGFFIGTMYDIYIIYDETFTDGDGFPLYSDGSMKSNYKRRSSTPKTSSAVTIIAVFASFIFLPGIISYIAVNALNSESHNNKDEIVQADVQKKDKNRATKEKTGKNEKKHKPGPIIDLPMNGTPVENITETVKQNTDALWDIVKFSNVKVDTSSGEANVLIVLQGAKGLTAQGTLDEFNRVIKQEIAALYQVNPGINISNVSVNVYMKVIDRKTGAEENILAYKVSMDKNAAHQMHWENYDSISIMSAATDVAMDPSFRNLVQSNAGRSVLDESLETLGF